MRSVPLPMFLRRTRTLSSAPAPEHAVVSVVRAELPRVERLLGRMLGPRADLEDLVQTVFVEACRSYPSFRGEGSLGAFIGGITVRVARRAMRGSAFSRHRADLEVEPASPGMNPEESYQHGQHMQAIRRALEKLAPKKRVAFTLWAFEGLEPAEIARLTGASLAATRSRIFYAQRELRQMALKNPSLRDALGGPDETR
ncbi:MAG: sigma-70 family RNA polymerase sigma factor [Myxococcales bacterium]